MHEGNWLAGYGGMCLFGPDQNSTQPNQNQKWSFWQLNMMYSWFLPSQVVPITAPSTLYEILKLDTK